MSNQSKQIAEKALEYMKLHATTEGLAFSFDADKYAEEILSQAMSDHYCKGVLVGRMVTYKAHGKYCENEIKQIEQKIERVYDVVLPR